MTSSTDNRELLADFVTESTESLQALPAHLNAYCRAPTDAESINAVFRAVHSIKGCAGFLGLGAIKAFSHSLENTLDEARKGKLTISDDMRRRFIEAFDLLDEMLQAAASGEQEQELGSRPRQLLDQIATLANDNRGPNDPESQLLDDLLQLADEVDKASEGGNPWGGRVRSLVTRFQATRESEQPAESDDGEAKPAARPPESFLSAACHAGDHDVTARVHEIAQFFIASRGSIVNDEAARAFIRQGTDFAEWALAANFNELAELLARAVKDFKTVHASPLDLDDTLLSVIWDHLWPAFSKLVPESEAAEAAPAASTAGASAKSPEEGAAKSSAAGGKARFVRVKEEHVDEFMSHVSNLFISCELYKDLHTRMLPAANLTALAEEMRQITAAFVEQSTALQHGVMALRRVAVGGLLSKFPRMARSLAGQLGKQIDVHVHGEDTEIDKSLLEDLDAPLTHMIRNVVDHAIETPDERRQKGASESGTLNLRAEQTRTHVVITIQDDGRGIDPRKLRAKAVEKGLITQAQADAMNDQEAIELIFAAGFSTAQKVSEVSGRGVGMDVVRTMIRNHNGEIYVDSTVGQGTIFRLEIPIREAVLVVDGLMLHHAGQDFVVPFEYVIEIAEFETAALTSVQGSLVTVIRGETYDVVRLGDILNLPSVPLGPRAQGVLIGCKQGAFCLLVDEVLGHRQAVINSLNEVLPGLDKINGVAQLGGGKLALVLSVPDVVTSLTRGKATPA